MINNRLSDLSCDEQVLNQAKDGYETTLKNSEYDTSLSPKMKGEDGIQETAK